MNPYHSAKSLSDLESAQYETNTGIFLRTKKEVGMVGEGINTVRVNGEVKHISELDPATLSIEWSKLKNENSELYRCIKEANSGWRGFILRLIGVRLPDGQTICIRGTNARNDSIYPE